jgi:CheY-like chemotaxis protein
MNNPIDRTRVPPVVIRPIGDHDAARRPGGVRPRGATERGTGGDVSPGDAPPSVTVLTVDDQALFRGVAREVIDATAGFEFVGEAASGEEAFSAVDRLDPQLVLLDVRLPGIDGIEVARRLHATHPGTLVVLISIEDPIDLPSAVQLGDGVPLVRKQDFGPRLLKRLWRERRA